MNPDPSFFRRFLLRLVDEGHAAILAGEFKVSPAQVYRLIRHAIDKGAIERLGECAYSAGEKWPVYVDHIDTAYGGDNLNSQLSKPMLSAENQGRAPRLLAGWTNTGSECTYVLLLPVPPELATKFRHWGRAWLHQESSRHGTAQFYVGKHAGSVVLHLAHRDYPDGLEDQVPKFQRAEFRDWMQEILDAYPGLQVVNRPIYHPDPKAQESRTPLPTGELVKRIEGVTWVPKEKVGPATQVDSSPPGPAVETAGIEEARAIARAPFELASLSARIDSLVAEMNGLGTQVSRLVDLLTPKPEGSGPTPPKDDGEHPEFG